MEGIGRGIGQLFLILFIGAALIGAILMGLIWGGIAMFSSDEMEVDHRLEPIRIEVRVTETIGKDGTKVEDSIYIYKKP